MAMQLLRILSIGRSERKYKGFCGFWQIGGGQILQREFLIDLQKQEKLC